MDKSDFKTYCKESVEKYKEHLTKPYWELGEAVALLCGCVDFMMYYCLDDEISNMWGISSFLMTPSNHRMDENSFNNISELIFNAANTDKIAARPVKLHKIKYSNPPENYTYLLKPYELISLALLEGIILSNELQIALNIYQIEVEKIPLSEPMKKEIKREAIAHALWYKYPEASISEINRKYHSLRKYRGYDFINDSQNRARAVVTKIQLMLTSL